MARVKVEDPGDLLTIADVAERSKLSVKTVRRAVERLEIAVTRFGTAIRISEAAYRDWVRRSTTDPVL